jgi:hypothetical protein
MTQGNCLELAETVVSSWFTEHGLDASQTTSLKEDIASALSQCINSEIESCARLVESIRFVPGYGQAPAALSDALAAAIRARGEKELSP